VHRLSTSFVLGYHGCDRSIGETLLAGKDVLHKSENAYDWLGPGMYFWEANPQRAIEFATEKLGRKHRIQRPFVIGAVIDLGLCLDLTTKDSLEDLKVAHESLLATIQANNSPAPVNGPAPWMRYLDCAVIRRLHEIIEDSGSPAVDTVRGIFQEGSPIYPGSAFLEKTHIQIAVVNPACIKAVFRVQEAVTT
jgi:hypothetical protein